jgi:hypothetical protein
MGFQDLLLVRVWILKIDVDEENMKFRVYINNDIEVISKNFSMMKVVHEFFFL